MKFIKIFRVCLGFCIINSFLLFTTGHGTLELRNTETLVAVSSAFFYLTTLVVSFFYKATTDIRHNFGFVILLIIPTTLLSIFLLVNLLTIDLDWTSFLVLTSVGALLGQIIIGSIIFLEGIRSKNQSTKAN